MKGLMIKDFIAIAANGRTLIFIVAIFMAMAMISGEVGVMSSALTAMIAVLGVNTFSYDEISHWDEFVVALPVKRSRIVLARYAVFLITCVGGVLLSFGLSCIVLFVTTMETGGFLQAASQTALSSGSSMVAVMALFSLMIPMIYKYGVQKMRILSMMIIIIPIGILVVMQNFQIPLPSAVAMVPLLKVLPFAAIGCFVVSYFVSVRIFAKKEF